MVLNEYGKIADNEWHKLPNRYQHIELDVFQTMPNHIHGIITVGATLAVAQNDAIAQNIETGAKTGATARVAPTEINAITIGNIVGAYKSLVSKECLNISKSKNEYMRRLWQRNYYEHIIRDDDGMNRVREYIQNNPLNWNSDQYNPLGSI